MKFKSLLTVFSLLIVVTCLMFAQGKQHKYVGVKKCQTCHKSKKSGEQYGIWQKGPHASALKSLSSDKAKEYAKANNIADPATDAKCLKCHATKATVDASLQEATLTLEEGVSCESCHGPGSDYKSMKIMKNKDEAIKNGLILPTEKVCKTCHNPENPFHKEFNYEVNKTKIAHPIPKKK
jgi:hypothetical protein